ncbi:ATP-binding protein [Candidatus Woesearchaeota archaeon]|nr:ATP-binding protein [Candidatus Woesearchaeota archaeon]
MATQDVFEEWNVYALKRQLIERDVNISSLISNSKLKVSAVTGIRRAGKSSLLMLIAQKLSKEGGKVAYINLEDSRIKYKPEVLDEVIKWFGDEGFLLLDEITSIKGWEDWLARTHELTKGKLRMIISSSRKGLTQPSKPLRGRIVQFEMYPLSFKEFLAFKGIKPEKTTASTGALEKALKEYLRFGGFPEVVLTQGETDKVSILNSYFKGIIGLDIAEVAHEDISVVEAFSNYAAQSTYFSASKCLNFFKTLGYKIGKEKLLALEHYSQEGFLFFFVPVFSYNIKDKSQYPRKDYTGDTGFIYAISGKTDMGQLFENAVFLELRRRLQNNKQVSYWKNKTGKEVDFVIRQGTSISEIIQVVYTLESDKTTNRELSALTECAKELKAKQGVLITKDKKRVKSQDKIKVTYTPLINWLLEKHAY